MKKLILLFVVTITFFCSCTTQQFVMNSTNDDLRPIKKIVIVNNGLSNVVVAGLFPSYENIDMFVKRKDPAISDIASLICTELVKKNINCEISYKPPAITSNIYYVEYQDYWVWDMKKYMHVLMIRLYKNEIEIKSVVSQANKMGLHDFPNAEKQTPLLIDLLLKNVSVQ